jgi:hypothetical protein
MMLSLSEGPAFPHCDGAFNDDANDSTPKNRSTNYGETMIFDIDNPTPKDIEDASGLELRGTRS